MDTSLLTHEIAKSLLYPEKRSIFISAEQDRPWSRRWTPAQRNLFPNSVLDQLWNCPLVRCYDAISGSQPCPQTSRMLAREARMRLDNEEIRIQTLGAHSDHKTWKKTPYISFTNCSQSLKGLADFRRTRKGRSHQRIVVIDPRVRFDLGLPILHLEAEMAHYRVNAPYEKDYWRNHYLCLWEVIPAEVVGIWDWDDLRKSSSWYEDVIIPAVKQRRQHMGSTISVQRDVCQNDLGLSAVVNDSDEDVHWNGSDDSYNSENDDEFGDGDESDDSYERVCEENLSGQLMNMWEDLRLE